MNMLFKVGDKVKPLELDVLGDDLFKLGWNPLMIYYCGVEGTVVGIDEDDFDVHVEFPDGRSWFYVASQLEKVEKESKQVDTEPKLQPVMTGLYKVGDFVKLKSKEEILKSEGYYQDEYGVIRFCDEAVVLNSELQYCGCYLEIVEVNKDFYGCKVCGTDRYVSFIEDVLEPTHVDTTTMVKKLLSKEYTYATRRGALGKLGKYGLYINNNGEFKSVIVGDEEYTANNYTDIDIVLTPEVIANDEWYLFYDHAEDEAEEAYEDLFNCLYKLIDMNFMDEEGFNSIVGILSQTRNKFKK